MSGESRDSGHGVLLGMDSSESRWVFQDEDENGEDLLSRVGLDSEEEEEEENGEQRLIRTGPRIDSFDVEALEVPGAQRNDYEVMNEELTHTFCFAIGFIIVGLKTCVAAVESSYIIEFFLICNWFECFGAF